MAFAHDHCCTLAKISFNINSTITFKSSCLFSLLFEKYSIWGLLIYQTGIESARLPEVCVSQHFTSEQAIALISTYFIPTCNFRCITSILINARFEATPVSHIFVYFHLPRCSFIIAVKNLPHGHGSMADLRHGRPGNVSVARRPKDLVNRRGSVQGDSGAVGIGSQMFFCFRKLRQIKNSWMTRIMLTDVSK